MSTATIQRYDIGDTYTTSDGREVMVLWVRDVAFLGQHVAVQDENGQRWSFHTEPDGIEKAKEADAQDVSELLAERDRLRDRIRRVVEGLDSGELVGDPDRIIEILWPESL